MTRRSIILVLGFCLPFLAHAAPRSAPSSRATTPALVVKFRPEPDAWTSRTVLTTTLSLELSSTGPSRVTTLTARRVLLAREELKRAKKGGGLQRTTTLRAVTATRNGQPETVSAEAALVGRPVGVKLSPAGKVLGTVGLMAARDAVSGRDSEVDPLAENPATSAELAGATPEEDGLKEAWDEESGRYLGLKLVPGATLYFSERLRLPFLKKELRYFSEQRVVGPVTVNGRQGLALDVVLFSMSMQQVPTGVSPTTGPASPFAEWARKARVRLSFPEMSVKGGGRRVIALDGKGLLEQNIVVDAELTGTLAAEAAGATTPAVTRVRVKSERQQQTLSGPPELAASGSGRNAAGRAESKKARKEDIEWK